MKIYTGSGTPIWISPRQNDDGVIVMQGTSRLMLSAAEIPQFLAAVERLSGVDRAGGYLWPR